MSGAAFLSRSERWKIKLFLEVSKGKSWTHICECEPILINVEQRVCRYFEVLGSLQPVKVEEKCWKGGVWPRCLIGRLNLHRARTVWVVPGAGWAPHWVELVPPLAGREYRVQRGNLHIQRPRETTRRGL